ncbi:S1/P1 nuclease [Roseateles cellulosilyticus]|uniref:S1/P1 nuclease n=1 Tax=Pelomonas cellulosilytica TaxID=2906762 RepID=A0ABS8Y2R3_9BURK|nr:S1/P1 nuclease [Pelomonas sp. P8]MCE4557980.1 S1/P1 nuclease [Pelomonas sp. P8]
MVSLWTQSTVQLCLVLGGFFALLMRLSIAAVRLVLSRHPYQCCKASSTQNRMQTLFSAATLLLFTLTSTAHAWGAEGHRLIGELAEIQLTPTAHSEVNRLLAAEPDATMSSVATWADEVRSPQTAHWHYVNPPLGDCSYARIRDCADGQCSVEALSKQIAVLKSKAPDEARRKALKWVIHLVGDLHQPLHAGFKGDKGGNLYQVRAFGRGTHLHSLWDGVMIRNRVGGIDELRRDASTAGLAAPATPRPAAWAVESCKIVIKTGFYPGGRFIEQSYIDRWDPVLVARLKSAAQRLAATLNDTLR